jgi:hypothetical protein
VPLARKAPAHAEIEEFEGIGALRFRIEGAELFDLLRQALARLLQRRGLVEAAEIQLVDDVEHKISKPITCTIGPVARMRRCGPSVSTCDELALEAEHGQEVGEIALDEAQRTRR